MSLNIYMLHKPSELINPFHQLVCPCGTCLWLLLRQVSNSQRLKQQQQQRPFQLLRKCTLSNISMGWAGHLLSTSAGKGTDNVESLRYNWDATVAMHGWMTNGKFEKEKTNLLKVPSRSSPTMAIFSRGEKTVKGINFFFKIMAIIKFKNKISA